MSEKKTTLPTLRLSSGKSRRTESADKPPSRQRPASGDPDIPARNKPWSRRPLKPRSAYSVTQTEQRPRPATTTPRAEVKAERRPRPAATAPRAEVKTERRPRPATTTPRAEVKTERQAVPRRDRRTLDTSDATRRSPRHDLRATDRIFPASQSLEQRKTTASSPARKNVWDTVSSPRSPGSKKRSLTGDSVKNVVHARQSAQGVRVSKLLSERGLCSRREADSYIERGWVHANGQIVTLGMRVPPDASLRLAPEAKVRQAKGITILLHNPARTANKAVIDLITAQNQWHRPSDPSFISHHLKKMTVAGGEDQDSAGLWVLTQDESIMRILSAADTGIEQEYLVQVEGKPIDLSLLSYGLSLDGEPLRPAYVEWIDGDRLRVVLRENRKCQIDRMCEQSGLKVIALKRIRIGHVWLGALPPGQWRYLSHDDKF